MPIFTYIKLGVVALLIIAGSYFYLDYRHAKAENVTLKAENKAQADTITFFRAAAKIDMDTAKHKEEIHEVIKSGDPQRIDALYRKLRKMSAEANDYPGTDTDNE